MPNKEKQEAKEAVKEEKNKDKKKIQELEEELAKANAAVEHWKNEYYRAYADTKNLRTNLEKEHSEAMKYRAMGFIEELLPVLDSFHMALGNEPASPEVKNYLVGFQFIYRNLVSILENEGVTEISPQIGDKFDPHTMNAVDTVEQEEENKVLKVYGNGYKLHDRIVRTAMVQVSVRPVENKENKEASEKVDA